ncbi:Cell division control protein 6 like protein [Argiope bruennichi]|uniref:Cell division control protein 6 like protein n=1 Tax=Argiope bruennichi TaxID=94029 RepID=A0A8T0FQT7_ARGBR|nr:Cell division control protein 6 like protein [Argiope bruennichi]
MSVQSHLRFPVKKGNILGSKSENSPVKSVGVKRALFGEAQSPASPKKARIVDENLPASPTKEKFSPKQVSSLLRAKQAFHTSLPTRLIGRSTEISEIQSYISERLNKKISGSLYISGAPGTGKTCSIMHVLESFDKKFAFAFVNCMSVSSPVAIYKTIAQELKLPSKVINSKNIADALKKHVSTSKIPVVLVLDEIEQLDCKGQQVLYNLFEWPHIPQSMFTLITISNAMDLTDRILPRLHTFKCQPKLMNFLTLYQRPDNSGDIRKALNVCTRAIQIVEKKLSQDGALKTTSDDRCNPGSPMKRVAATQCVDVQEISAVLHKIHGSRLQATNFAANSETVILPLHSMILLCTLVLMKKHCKPQDMTVGKAYHTYKRICQKRDITSVNESEFHRLCCDVECRGFLLLKPAKAARLAKIVLKVDEVEAERVMQDKAMLPAILADHSVLNKCGPDGKFHYSSAVILPRRGGWTIGNKWPLTSSFEALFAKEEVFQVLLLFHERNHYPDNEITGLGK